MSRTSKKAGNASGLTERQEAFCREYLIDLNGTQAAIRAGYSKNEVTAATEASRLLRNDKIVRFLQTLMDRRAKRVEVSADEVLRELTRLGYSDLRGLFNDDGTIKQPKDWSEDLARAVASIEVEELFDYHAGERTWIGYTKKVKFWPKDRALEMMGKHKRLFADKVEHEHKHTLADLVAGSKEDETDE